MQKVFSVIKVFDKTCCNTSYFWDLKPKYQICLKLKIHVCSQKPESKPVLFLSFKLSVFELQLMFNVVTPAPHLVSTFWLLNSDISCAGSALCN